MASTPVTEWRSWEREAGANCPAFPLRSAVSTGLARGIEFAPAGLAGVALATSCLTSGDLSALRVVLAAGLGAHALGAAIGLRSVAGAGLSGVAQASAVFWRRPRESSPGRKSWRSSRPSRVSSSR